MPYRTGGSRPVDLFEYQFGERSPLFHCFIMGLCSMCGRSEDLYLTPCDFFAADPADQPAVHPPERNVDQLYVQDGSMSGFYPATGFFSEVVKSFKPGFSSRDLRGEIEASDSLRARDVESRSAVSALNTFFAFMDPDRSAALRTGEIWIRCLSSFACFRCHVSSTS